MENIDEIDIRSITIVQQFYDKQHRRMMANCILIVIDSNSNYEYLLTLRNIKTFICNITE